MAETGRQKGVPYMANPPRLMLAFAAGMLAFASPSLLAGAGKTGCPPGYTMQATGTCGHASQPKPPCPPGYAMRPTGTCGHASQPKPPARPATR
jgi:hypothetical protein